MKKQTICRYIIHLQSQNLEVYVSVQKLKKSTFAFRDQHFLAVVWVWQKDGRNPFFAIIWAKMDEIQKFLRELVRTNDVIYYPKYETHMINIKWSGA